MDQKKDTKYVHLTYPYDRPGPKKTDPKLNIEKTHRPFNYATPSVKGISEVPWKDIIACTISSGGSSNGAILLQSMEGNFAVKGSSNPALEYFAFLVFKELKIRAPATRVIQHTDDEFKLALDYIQKASYADNTLKYKVRQVLDRPFLLLMEYVPFQKIYQLGEKRAKMCFDPAYPDGRDRLIRLGITYAVDTLLNMRDRYPLIWGTAGNPENMLIGFDTNWVTKNEELFDRNNTDLQMTFMSPIDNKPVLIGKKTGLSQEAYDLYLEEFEKIVRFSFEGLKPVKEGRINPFDSTTKRFDYTSLASTFIYNQSSHDIKTLGELQILLGLVIGYVNIYNMTFQRIEKMKKKVAGMLKTDWKNLWTDDCENIRLDIIKDEIKIIEKYMRGNEEIIGWVSTITLNNYFITFEKLKEDDLDGSIALNEDSFSGKGLSSKNVDEYDEWLEKKVDEYFGINQPGEYRGPPQHNPDPYMNTGLPVQPNPTPVTDQQNPSRDSPASPKTGKTGKTAKGGKSPKSAKGGKTGKQTPGRASPTQNLPDQRSPSPTGHPGSPSLADSIPQSNQQVGSGTQSNQQIPGGLINGILQPADPGSNPAAGQQGEPNPKEDGKKDKEPEAPKKKKKGFFW